MGGGPWRNFPSEYPSKDGPSAALSKLQPRQVDSERPNQAACPTLVLHLSLLYGRSYGGYKRWLGNCPSIARSSFKAAPRPSHQHSITTTSSLHSKFPSITMSNPRVFFDVTIGGSPAGRIVMELFADQVPKVSAPLSESSSSLFLP